MTRQDTVASPVLVQIEHLLGARRFKNVQVFHHELVFFGPAYAQTCLAFNAITSLAADSLHNLWVEQVKDFLVVDLQKADKHAVMALRFHRFHLFDPREKLIDASLSYSNVFFNL